MNSEKWKSLKNAGRLLLGIFAAAMVAVIIGALLLVFAMELDPGAFGYTRGPGGYAFDADDYNEYLSQEARHDMGQHRAEHIAAMDQRRVDSELEKQSRAHVPSLSIAEKTSIEYPAPYMHKANESEIKEWSDGFIARGGDPAKYYNASSKDGWYVVEKDFRTENLSTGITELHIDNTSIVDGNVNNIIVPRNVTHLGGEIGKDIDFFLMKDFTIIPRSK